MTTTAENVRRLVRAATGEDYGDGYTVSNVVKGYAEPGYGTDDDLIVLGDWNPKRWTRTERGETPDAWQGSRVYWIKYERPPRIEHIA